MNNEEWRLTELITFTFGRKQKLYHVLLVSSCVKSIQELHQGIFYLTVNLRYTGELYIDSFHLPSQNMAGYRLWQASQRTT
jgi:hypothetical protein